MTTAAVTDIDRSEIRISPTGGGIVEPTLASTWLGASGAPIDDAMLEWPPDVFALTDVLLERGDAFRFVLSPPPDAVWPPDPLR